jgi:integrase
VTKTKKTKIVTAVRTAITALRHAGASNDQIATAIASMGLATPAPTTVKKSKTKMITSEDQVKSVAPGVYRVGGNGTQRLYLKKGLLGGSYFVRYRIHGRRPEMGIGSIDDVTLAQAKAKAGEIAVKLADRNDPLEERERDRAAKAAEAAKGRTPTVKEAVLAYLDINVPTWKHVYARQSWLSPVETYAFPAIGHLRVDTVEPRHILKVLADCDKKGLSSVGRKIRSRLRTVFSGLVAHGQLSSDRINPCDAAVINAARPRNGEVETGHYRRIDLAAAPAAFQQLVKLNESKDGSNMTACWLYLILTAARPTEALSAEWSEINLVNKLWTIPGSKTKTGKDHAVPLSDAAVTVLERQPHVSNLIFPNRGGGRLAHSNFTKAPEKGGIEAGTPHSWRSIFRDACGDVLRVDRDLAEAALAHTLNKTESAYRRGTAIEARRPVMAAYAAFLFDEGTNVVALPRRA